MNFKLAGEVFFAIFMPNSGLELYGVHYPEIVEFHSFNEILENMMNLAVGIAAHDGLFHIGNGYDGNGAESGTSVIQKPQSSHHGGILSYGDHVMNLRL